MLEPGPELDAAVAKAIGWTLTDSHGWVELEKPTGLLGPKVYGHNLPKFSTDANMALEAAESADHPFIFFKGMDTKRWTVSFMLPREDGTLWFRRAVEGDTVPHALCLAILAAKEKP